ncbi:MAG TPA: hypothetical protein VE817_03950, partial [Candidatus Acidoferrum sp.]|nr:hypothetical protein [Candidatus Acidoferrum sp.]
LAHEGTPCDGDVDRGIGEKVRGPGPIERSRRDQDRSIGLADEADGDLPRFAGSSAAHPETGEPLVVREGLVEIRNALGSPGRP